MGAEGGEGGCQAGRSQKGRSQEFGQRTKHADFNYDNMSMTGLTDYYYDCFKTC